METFLVKRENICFGERYTLISENGLFSIVGYVSSVVDGEDVLKDTCSFTITVSKDKTDYDELSKALKYLETYIAKAEPAVVLFNTIANVDYKKLHSILHSNGYKVYDVSEDKNRMFNLYKKYIKD